MCSCFCYDIFVFVFVLALNMLCFQAIKYMYVCMYVCMYVKTNLFVLSFTHLPGYKNFRFVQIERI